MDSTLISGKRYLFAYCITDGAFDDWDEADFIVNDIRKNILNGENYRNHMILTRSMYACRTFEAECISSNIPYHCRCNGDGKSM